MSIKQKFIICSVIMLVIPVVMIVLLSLLLIAVFALIHPSVELSLTEGLEISNPIVMKFWVIWSIMSLFIIISGVIAVTAYLSHSLLRPLKDLTLAMEHLKNGNLSYEFSGSGDKEIQALCQAYDELRLKLQTTAAEALEYEQEQRMMLANISHDIKTPVTSIRGYVEGIQDGIADTPEKMDRYLTTIHSKTDAIELMAENLSLYAKLEMKRMNYHMEITNFYDFIRKSTKEFELDLLQNNIQLTYNLPDSDIPIKLDKEKMRRVFANLITNAIKYKKEGAGSLNISGSISAHGALVTFTDKGTGIVPDDLERVFESFYRSDISRNSKISGNGLGLSICRHIIEDHGGKIWIRSELGAGTEVIMLLPAEQLRKGM